MCLITKYGGLIVNHTQTEINITGRKKTSIRLQNIFYDNLINYAILSSGTYVNYRSNVALTKAGTKKSVAENRFTVWRSSAINNCQS